MPSSKASASRATRSAVAQLTGSAPAREIASALQSWMRAVSVAPTVPECKIALPVLAPRLIPERTTCGAAPKAPRLAMSAMKPGVPATA